MNLLSKYLIRKAIAKNKAIKGSISFEKAKQIYVLYDFDNQFSKLNILQSSLNKYENKNIQYIGFSSQKRKQIDASDNGVVSKDDFGFFLSPKTIFLKKALVNRSDMLINLIDSSKETVLLFLALSKAKQVIGKGGSYAELTDFILNDEMQSDIVNYVETLIEYTNKIQ